MAGYTQVYERDTLDRNHPTTGNGDFVAYSVNGTSEFAGLARTAIGATGWAAATAATPSVKANGVALTSANATAAGTVSHYAIFSASTSGVQKTDWTTVDTARTVAIGDNVNWPIGTVRVTMD